MTINRTLFWVGLALVVFLVLWFSAIVLVVGYEGRKDIVVSNREGCERGKLDRKAAVVFHEATLDAFKDTDATRGGQRSIARIRAEGEIEGEVAGLKDRAEIDCHVVYPNARFLP